MNPQDIERLIEARIPGTTAQVEGDGSHFYAELVSPAFEGLSRLKRQQLVLTQLQAEIASGELHALSFKKTLTPDELQASQA